MSPQTPQSKRRMGMSSQLPASLSDPRELVQEYPVSSTLLAFGVGLGVGILVGQTVASAFTPDPTPTSRLDALSQQVYNAVRNAIPEALGRHLQR
jgi:hypothetical protein